MSQIQMNDKCQICLSVKRPLKYKTRRINICQWCVSDLLEVNIDPNEIRNHLMKIIEQNLPKAPAEPKKEHAKGYAINELNKYDNIYDSIIKSTLHKKRYNQEVEKLTEKIYSERISKYNEYYNNLRGMIENRYNDLLSGEYIPTGTVYIKYTRFGTYDYKGCTLNSIDKKHIKYMRAHNLKLLSGTDKEKRLDETIMRTIKADVRTEDNKSCVICKDSGTTVELHVHHIIPLDKYGSNNFNNLVTLCYSCHNKQHVDVNVKKHNKNKKKKNTRKKEQNHTRKIIDYNSISQFEKPFVCVDIETTGLHENDKIIEISAVKFEPIKYNHIYMYSHSLDTFSCLVNPGKHIPKNITELTGISNINVKDSPRIETIINDFYSFIGNDALVFHNHSFDIRFIEREFSHLVNNNNEIIDTLTLSRKVLPESINHKLKTLVNYFCLDDLPSHRSLNDCISTGQVFVKLLNELNKDNKRIYLLISPS